ncbi:hypothetical protein EDB81DRAFT_398137 [Dactylonectria macrodidyma]|uniref:Uncharacterized protein n=1 Tax=Dactylonectria macrodidyma TaxID=307937 RepID=A0A9P9FA50_9HYPO|nr:hypothetical protein EDB81DRAFT_398137 [Dactylonectria macrodidyma]
MAWKKERSPIPPQRSFHGRSFAQSEASQHRRSGTPSIPPSHRPLQFLFFSSPSSDFSSAITHHSLLYRLVFLISYIYLFPFPAFSRDYGLLLLLKLRLSIRSCRSTSTTYYTPARLNTANVGIVPGRARPPSDHSLDRHKTICYSTNHHDICSRKAWCACNCAIDGLVFTVA